MRSVNFNTHAFAFLKMCVSSSMKDMPTPTRDETLRIFEASPLLETLPKREIAELVPHARHRDLAPGEAVFLADSSDRDFYWVSRGRLRLTTNNRNGGELLHAMAEVGNQFGEVTPIDGGMRGVNAIADQSSSVITLDREVLLPVVLQYPESALRLAQLLCRQIRLAGETLHNLALNNAEARIWTRLIQMSKTYGTIDPASGALHVAHGLSQQDLASTVGLTRVKVNRQLTLWREHGLVDYGRGYVAIRDPESFEAYVWEKIEAPGAPDGG